MATTARRPRLQTFAVGGEQFTTVVMTSGDLAALDIEHLDLPEDRTGMEGLRDWDVYDGAGTHMGRVVGRSTVVAAEWLDTLTDDWLLAKWSCRRLERAVHEIVRLRDDHAAQRAAADARRTELQQRVDYADHLQRHGLVLDEVGDERYAGRTSHAASAPGFGDVFAN